jgi:Zn finger protein HypA/HybF involved in hydrogenase expression
MGITCQLCNQTFTKFISGKHLKYKHGITGDEYKSQFGSDSLCTPEFREDRRKSSLGLNKGKPAHNKGKKVTDPDHLASIRAAIDKREQRYKESGSHPHKGKSPSEATKRKIGASVSQYALENPEDVKARAAKAKQTLRDKGYDFGALMRGKKHTAETVEKIRESSIQTNKVKSEKSLESLKIAIEKTNIDLLKIEDKKLTLECRACNNQFHMTRQYFSDSKWRADICPVCRPEKVKSAAELEILAHVRHMLPDTLIISGDKHTISPQELDILIPSKNLAIEYCGLYWHSELQGKHRMYHKYKMENCAAQGIRLITIFEDEWLLNPELVRSRLNVILGVVQKKIPARKCDVKMIDTQTARKFCEQNHIQGKGSASAAVGLFHDTQLVSVMTFSKPNISKGGKNSPHTWELNRMCALQSHVIQGGANRMFKLFVNTHAPSQVITYCDLRWNTGGVYGLMGFEQTHTGFPNYWYLKLPELKRYHRFGLRKTDQDDQTLTEWDNRKAQGYDRIWDCGHSKWMWNKKEE